MRKVHFWMGFHKLVQLILFIELVRCGKALLLLSHVKHHFFHSRSGLSVEVREFWRFRVDFLCVDLNIALNWTVPPGCLVFPFLDIDVNVFSFVAIELSILNCPVSLFRVDFVFPFSINESLSLDDYFQFINCEVDFCGLFNNIRINKNKHLKILQLKQKLPPEFESKCTYLFCHHFLLELAHYLLTFFMCLLGFRLFWSILLWRLFMLVVRLFSFIQLTSFLISIFFFFLLLLYVLVLAFRFTFFKHYTFQNLIYMRQRLFIMLVFGWQRSQFFFLRIQTGYQKIRWYCLFVEWLS